MTESLPVDPHQLEQLIIKAAALRDQGNEDFIESVLAAVDQSGKRALREKLHAHFDIDASAPFDTILTGDAAESHNTPVSDQTQINQPAFRTPSKAKTDEKNRVQKDLPSKIGKFRIKRELGRGAFGVVYQGFDEELERKVAIKVSLVKSRKWQSRLRTEAAKLAKTESTGIVPVYDIGSTDEGAVYIVQKYIDGCTLRDLIRKRPLSPARAARLIRAIAIGLEPAHRKEILHRDLKPDNILIDESGKPWIADFGLAISEQEQFSKGREVAGTPLYMSPEQIRGRVDFLDPRSDIWALGVMLYEVLTNKLPFNGKSTKALTDQICELDPRPLHQRAPGVLPEALNEIFERCCAKQPADRFATVRELADALDELISSGLGDRNILGEVVPLSVADSAIMDSYGSLSDSGGGKDLTSPTNVESRLPAGGHEPSSHQSTAHSWSILSRGLAFIAVIAISILGSVGVIHYLSKEHLGTEPGTRSKQAESQAKNEDDVPTEREVVAANPQPSAVTIDADGTQEKPWIVASDGTGSHTTIAAAVSDSAPDALIRLKPGTYNESVQIQHSVTLEGLPAANSEQPNFVCAIENDSASPIVIDGLNCIATIRNIRIEGKGHPTSKEFNAIDVVQGMLVLDQCSVTSSSYNCVKLRTSTSLDAQHTHFRDAREFAISTKDQSQLTLQECSFRNSGVQIVGGPGVLDDCSFLGRVGVYVADSTEQVAIGNCTFQDNFEYGLAVAAGGNVACQKNRFTNCRYGVWAIGKEESTGSKNSMPAIVNATNSTWNDCEVAINVQGGILRASDQCQIVGGSIGIGVQTGEVHLEGLTISDTTNGIKVTDDSTVHLTGCTIQKCSATALDMLAGRLEIEKGSIRQCTNGIALGDKDRWPDRSVRGTISDLSIEFSDNQGAGIMAYSGPLEIAGLTLTRGMFGVYAEGPKAEHLSHVPPTELTISGSTFIGQSDVCVVAIGDCRVTLADSPAQPREKGRPTLAREPAEIIEKKSQ